MEGQSGDWSMARVSGGQHGDARHQSPFSMRGGLMRRWQISANWMSSWGGMRPLYIYIRTTLNHSDPQI